MRIFSIEIIGLQMRRYDLAATYNVIPGHLPTFPSAGPAWETPLTLPTYDQLIERLRSHLAIDSERPAKSAVQRFRNHTSTLHSFLAHIGKTSASRTGAELRSHFDASVRDYLAVCGVSQRSKRDRRGHLALFRKLADDATPRPSSATQAQELPKLAQELRAAISRTGIASKTLAKQAGISPSAIQRWLKGAAPNRRGLAPLRRLESQLGFPRDHLTRLVDGAPETPPHPAPRRIAYRESLQTRKACSRILPESQLQPQFLKEWQALLSYKTSALTALNRQRRGVWRLIPRHTACSLSALAERGDWACPTADYTLGQIRLFLGAVENSAQELGVITAEDDWQTLALLAQPAALSVGLNYITEHAGGLRHGTQKTFCTTVSALLRPTSGYLWQQPHFRHRLPESQRPADDAAWQAMCERSHAMLLEFKSQAKDQGRRPNEPIEDLLAMENPLKPVLQAITRLDAAAASAPPGSVSEARFRRDALLLGLLVANPLRARSYITMTWSDDQQCMLRDGPEGWRIHLERHHLKNGNGRAGKDYTVRVATWLQSRLTAYIEEFRPTLLRSVNSPYLFPARDGGKWLLLSKRVQVLTKRYIPGSPGFGPHAFRHLVATAWLQSNPSDFLTVAELLNDRLETVLENYAHLKRDTSFGRYEQSIEALLQTC